MKRVFIISNIFCFICSISVNCFYGFLFWQLNFSVSFKLLYRLFFRKIFDFFLFAKISSHKIHDDYASMEINSFEMSKNSYYKHHSLVQFQETTGILSSLFNLYQSGCLNKQFICQNKKIHLTILKLIFLKFLIFHNN